MADQIEVLFDGPKGSLRLCVEGYQFPNLLNEEWDSDWLMVVGEAVLDGKLWRFRDPCLTTFEVERLADWLDQIAAGGAKRAFCGFTEPNLDFERRSDQSIRIGFSMEALPPWVDHESDFGAIGFDVPITDDLKIAARSLRTLLSLYPVRVRPRLP